MGSTSKSFAAVTLAVLRPPVTDGMACSDGLVGEAQLPLSAPQVETFIYCSSHAPLRPSSAYVESRYGAIESRPPWF